MSALCGCWSQARPTVAEFKLLARLPTRDLEVRDPPKEELGATLTMVLTFLNADPSALQLLCTLALPQRGWKSHFS